MSSKSIETPKKVYQKPNLIVYGTIETVTGTVSGSNMDDGGPPPSPASKTS